MGYGHGFVWPPIGDALVSSHIVCMLARGCRAAFSGVVDYLSLHPVESLAGEERYYV